MKPTNWVTMINGLGHAEPVQHLARLQPAIGADRRLPDIGEHGIGAPEGDYRHFGEEDGDLAEHVAGAEGRHEERGRRQPEHEKGRGDLERPGQRWPGMRRQVLAEPAVGVGDLLPAERAVAAARVERREAGAPAEPADQGGAEDDQRERQVEHEDRDEGGGREADHQRVPERAAADPQHGLEHDCQHRGLEPEEQRRDHADLAEGGIEPAQRHDRDHARQHEQRAGDQSALGPVQEPADVDHQLLRLRPGQEHAVVERMQKAALADPALLLDQDAVHDRDLPGRPAEAQRGDPGPDAERLAERNAVGGDVRRRDAGAGEVGQRLCLRRKP
jgi:hypothetical protein